MADKKISELDSTTSVNTGAMFPLSQTESGSLKTVKGTVEQIGDYIAKTQDHSTLNTSSKKIIGAINEILAGSIEGTASGSVASFADGGDNIPVKSLVAEIVASQVGSGTPSPSNPRAISGYTDVVIKNDVQGTTEATYTISLGSTVYGGTLDVTKGILTVTYKIITDLGDVVWTLHDANHIFRTPVSDIKNPTDNAERREGIICSCYKPSESVLINASMDNEGMLKLANQLYVRDNAYSDATTFKSSLSGQQFAYELATPVVIQLTPTEVRTLLGENNIYANSGDVEVAYFTDKANEIADLVETYMGDFESGTVRSYTATLTSSEYGWFTFVDENGSNLLASVGIPLHATAKVGSKYYHGLFSQQAYGNWLFKVADINDSGNYKPIGTSLSNIQFNLSYTKL